jgi:hypothetical protein
MAGFGFPVLVAPAKLPETYTEFTEALGMEMLG